MTVAHILEGKPQGSITMAPDARLRDAVALLAEKKIGAVVITDSRKRLLGILSERDIVRGLAGEGPAVLDQTVSHLMTPNVKTCTPDESVDSVMARMTQGRFRHMPVVEDGILTGVVSIGDMVKARLAQLEQEADQLKNYIAGG